MNVLLAALLSNALLATALALLIPVVNRFWKNPSAMHLLWLLVLVKLLTPPIFSLSSRWMPAMSASGVLEAVNTAGVHPPAESLQNSAFTPAAMLPDVSLGIAGTLLILWISGAAVFLLSSVVRARRFNRLLEAGQPASSRLFERARELSQRLGLASVPRLIVVPARVSPLVWGPLRRPTIVLPEGLLARTDESAQAALLAHELAHVRRKDHWIRLVETLATSLFWWHPVLWWARHKLHECEEVCCDAWALEVLSDNPSRYAHTLVDTVDFLSNCGRIPLASNWRTGSDKTLRRRLTMIMLGNHRKRLPFLTQLAIAGLAIAFLPLSAAAQDPAPSQDPKPTATPEKQIDTKKIDEAVDKAMSEVDIDAIVAQALEAATLALQQIDIQKIVDQSLNDARITESVSQALKEVDQAQISEEVRKALEEADIDGEIRKAMEEVRKELDSGEIRKAIEEAMSEIEREKAALEARKATRKAQESPPQPPQK